MLGNGYGNGYSTTTQSTFYFPYPTYSNIPWSSPPPASKRERKLRELLAKFDGDTKKLGFRLQAEEIERKARSDVESRRRKPHPSSRAPTDRRLQTYDAALAARMASRRP